MTDEKTAPEPVKIGTDVKDALAAFQEAKASHHAATNAAYDERREELAATETNIRTAKDALYEEFGAYSSEADTLVRMIDLLVGPRHTDKTKAIRQAYTDKISALDAALKAAQENLNAALDADPFTKYLRTLMFNGYRDEAGTVLEALPATIEELKTVADDNDWCTTFEQLIASGIERGFIEPLGTYEVVREVPDWCLAEMPEKYDAKEGEKWEAVVQVPAYMRERKYGLDDLIEYSDSVTYRRAGEETDDKD